MSALIVFAATTALRNCHPHPTPSRPRKSTAPGAAAAIDAKLVDPEMNAAEEEPRR
jgi:hypothetical protein